MHIDQGPHADADIVLEDSFYRPLTPEQSKMAFRNEFDFDAPNAIDFDVLVDRLRDIQQGYSAASPLTWLQVVADKIPERKPRSPSIHFPSIKESRRPIRYTPLMYSY